MRYLHLIVFCLIGFEINSFSASDDDASNVDSLETARTIAEAIWTGYRNQRDELVTGRFTATGTFHRRAGEVEFTVDTRVFGVFDYSNSRYRFDRWEKEPRGTESLELGGRYARTDDCALLQRFKDTVFVHEAGTRPLPGMNVFDVRAIGITGYADHIGGRDLAVCDKIWRHVSVIETVAEESGLVRIIWLMGKHKEVKVTVWFDRSRGYCPIRREERYRKADSTGNALIEPPEFGDIECFSETSWISRSDVWVPATFVLTLEAGRTNSPTQTELYEYKLAFEWTEVNTEVDLNWFKESTFRDFDNDRRAVVADTRLGSMPVIVSHPDVPDVKSLRKYNEAMLHRETVRVAPASSAHRQILIVVNVVVLVILFACISISRRNRGPESPDPQ